MITGMARRAVLRAPNKLNKSDEYDRRSDARLVVVSFVASECLCKVRKWMEAIATMTHNCVRSRELCVTNGLSPNTHTHTIVGRRAGMKAS